MTSSNVGQPAESSPPAAGGTFEMHDDPFDFARPERGGWALIEILGHRSHFGFVRQITVFGAAQVHVLVFWSNKPGVHMQHSYGGGSIFGTTPMSKAECISRSPRFFESPSGPQLPAHDEQDEDEREEEQENEARDSSLLELGEQMVSFATGAFGNRPCPFCEGTLQGPHDRTASIGDDGDDECPLGVHLRMHEYEVAETSHG